MQIRPATSEDVEPLARVHVRSWQVAYRGLIPDETLDKLDVAERAARWRATFGDGDQDVLVAVDDGTVRGFCSLQPARDEMDSRETVGEITSLYVDPEHWRQGLGRASYSAIAARARQRGFRELVLWVLEENHAARRFYERMGFHRDAGAGFTRGFGGGVELSENRYRVRL